MSYDITVFDKDLVKQRILHIKAKLEILDQNNHVISKIEGGIVSGSSTVDAESDVRRTISLTLIPDLQNDVFIDEDGAIWLDKRIRLSIGIKNVNSGHNFTKNIDSNSTVYYTDDFGNTYTEQEYNNLGFTQTDEYRWWPQGVYMFMSTSATYDATTNQLEISCSDLMSVLDGTRNGMVGGANTIEFSAYNEATKWASENMYSAGDYVYYPTLADGYIYKCIADNRDIDWTESHWTKAYDKNGEHIKAYENSRSNIIVSYNYVRDYIKDAVTNLSCVIDPQIDNVGEAKAFPHYDYMWDEIYWKDVTEDGENVETTLAKWQAWGYDAYINTTDGTKTLNHVYVHISDKQAYIESSKITGIDQNEYMTCYALPYDLSFDAGCTVLDIVQGLRDLYEGFEAFFDENGIFKVQQIPSGEDDPIIYDNAFIQKILVSEETSYDFTEVKNILECWGESFDPEFYHDFNNKNYGTIEQKVENGARYYSFTIDGYTDDDHTEYYNGDEFAFRIPDPGSTTGYVEENALYINLNNLGYIPIYDENDETFLLPNTLMKNCVYTFRIRKRRINGQNEMVAYFKGMYQVHCLDVLTDGTSYTNIVSGERISAAEYNTAGVLSEAEKREFAYYYATNKNSSKMITMDAYDALSDSEKTQYKTNKYTKSDGTYCREYSAEYYADKYNCEISNVHETIIEGSPFTVQKLGNILDVYTNEDINSVSIGMETARQQNYRNNRLTDTITIVTRLCPFADVNKKVSYKRSDQTNEEEYIVKSVSHDWSSGQTTWKLMKFYKLYYNDDSRYNGTHYRLGKHTHRYLGLYRHERLEELVI